MSSGADLDYMVHKYLEAKEARKSAMRAFLYDADGAQWRDYHLGLRGPVGWAGPTAANWLPPLPSSLGLTLPIVPCTGGVGRPHRGQLAAAVGGLPAGRLGGDGALDWRPRGEWTAAAGGLITC